MDAISLSSSIILSPVASSSSPVSIAASTGASARQNFTAATSTLSVADATQTTATISLTSQNSVAYTAQSLAQENIPGVVGIETQSAQFTPAVQYDQLVADSFIKYKPSYAALPESSVFAASAASAYQSSSTTKITPAPQVSMDG